MSPALHWKKAINQHCKTVSKSAEGHFSFQHAQTHRRRSAVSQDVLLCFWIRPRQNSIKSSSIFHTPLKIKKKSHVSVQIVESLNVTPTLITLTSPPGGCSIHFSCNLHCSVVASNMISAVMCFYCSSCNAARYRSLSHRCTESLEGFGEPHLPP